MAILIGVVTIILYIILLGFTWHNLGPIADNKIKIIYVVVGLAIMLLVTLIIFSVSKNGIEYQNANMVGDVRNMLLAVFVPVNGMIVMPFLANVLSKITTNDITQEIFKKRIIVLAVLFLIALIIECSYFKNIQLGILKIISKM